MHIVLIILAIWILIGWLARDKPKPNPVFKPWTEEEKAQHLTSCWTDFGTQVDILGRTFINNGNNGYEYKGLVFGHHTVTNKNCYSISPNIALSQEDFLTRLEKL